MSYLCMRSAYILVYMQRSSCKHAPSSFPHTTSSYHYICVLALLAHTGIYAEEQLCTRELRCYLCSTYTATCYISHSSYWYICRGAAVCARTPSLFELSYSPAVRMLTRMLTYALAYADVCAAIPLAFRAFRLSCGMYVSSYCCPHTTSLY